MSLRLVYLISFFIIAFLLSMGFYLQYVGYEPCLLCIIQRICFGALGILFLSGFVMFRNKIAMLFINSLLLFFSLAGAVLAARQIWLQYFGQATNETECLPSLNYMMKILPLNEIAKKVLEGGSDCTERGWQFLTLDIAEWAFVWFVIFFMLSFVLMIKRSIKH